MTLSRPIPPLVPARGQVKTLWTQPIPVVPRGVALAREKGSVLAWDEKHWLHLLNGRGERQGQYRPPGKLTSACCADDGSALAAGGSQGEVWFLAPDLALRWERSLPSRVMAMALDPFGQYLAAADNRNNLHILDRTGRIVTQVPSARPLHHLAFVPAAPILVACADYGLVAALDLGGEWVWRDTVVAHFGSLAVSGDGERIMLACFTEGLRRYDRSGKVRERVPTPEPCRLVEVTFDGRLALVAGLSNRFSLIDGTGRVLHTHTFDKPITALALTALGDTAVIGLAEGLLAALDLRDILPR